MTPFLAVFAIAFGAILLVELPDKTLIATLVLSTKYRPRPVLVGVACAFAIQCVLAVTAGGLLHLLPHRILEAIVAVLFAVGAFMLFRESVSDEEDDIEDETPAAVSLSNRRIFGISFGVLFAAEWGDASQLATAGLVARYGQPIAIGLGAFLALVGVAVLAVLAGKAILRKVPLELVHRIAAGLFAVFAIVAGVAAIRG
ncbi:TMEM165/GDT1 family protein [Jatrophihabitans lederbergiae]|jgi:putative Ca2+/H+ antiporter (TMEM165/GDT1 family)|uniref:GDT1 family protein n=1 Tax=Jatrophihabitans lederbergiae TaxID=3075547 RepID=A0ABU2JB77_9ACTN|nr:TMEM165/GDT1 family protein [Jatrophihabitans sp. DSM 44399]MDT0262207.1 TMEM165/GDT1 family protein [Jatrophihabitans sp. DSM 44399]